MRSSLLERTRPLWIRASQLAAVARRCGVPPPPLLKSSWPRSLAVSLRVPLLLATWYHPHHVQSQLPPSLSVVRPLAEQRRAAA
eukprot:scaffold99373_cov29-Tisochrysis_lutea.AAC.2